MEGERRLIAVPTKVLLWRKEGGKERGRRRCVCGVVVVDCLPGVLSRQHRHCSGLMG